jgi:hypothetical protein
VGNGVVNLSESCCLALTLRQIRVRNYDRNVPVTDPTDWDEPRFGWIFVLFMLNWVFSVSLKDEQLVFIPILTLE